MTNLACVLWWLIPGVFLGWVLSWLFDMLFRRDGTPLIERAQADLAAAQAKANGLDGELTASRNSLAAHQNELVRVKSELSAARTAHEQAQGSLGLMQTELDGRSATVSKYTTDFNALQAQFTTARQSQASLESTVASLRGELDTAKQSAAAAQSKLKAEHASALAQAVAEAEKLKADVAASAKSQIDIMRSFTALQHENETYKASSSSSSGELSALRRQLDALRVEKDQGLSLLQTDLSGHKTSLSAAMSEADSLKVQLAKLRDEQAKATAELSLITTDGGRLKTALATAEARIGDLTKFERAHADLSATYAKTLASNAGLERQLAESKNLIALLQADIEGNKRSQQAHSGRVTGMERAAQMEAERRINMTRYGFVSRTRDRDDLTLVEGIGPKIEELLLAAGIDTHAKLAVCPVEEIRHVLDAAGPAFKIANPGTWPRQAGLIVRNDWAELRRWQDVLIAGVEPPTSGA